MTVTAHTSTVDTLIEPPAVELREATDSDRPALVDLMTAAYTADPVISWLFPDSPTRQMFAPRYFGLFLDLALTHGSVQVTTDLSAVALWLDPDRDRPDPDDPRLFVRLARACGPALPRFSALDERTSRYHPGGPHTFLTALAVTPSRQRQGIGTGLLRHRLAGLEPGRLAYLEATSTRSANLFEREGFRPLLRARSGNIRARKGPMVCPMWRAA